MRQDKFLELCRNKLKAYTFLAEVLVISPKKG